MILFPITNYTFTSNRKLFLMSGGEDVSGIKVSRVEESLVGSEAEGIAVEAVAIAQVVTLVEIRGWIC